MTRREIEIEKSGGTAERVEQTSEEYLAKMMETHRQS